MYWRVISVIMTLKRLGFLLNNHCIRTKRLRSSISVAVGAFCLATLLGSSVTRAQTLSDALIAAYLNNPTLLASRAALRATDEGVPQALANWRPEVTVTGDYGMSRITNTRNTGSDIDQVRHPRGLGMTLSQPLFRGGRTLAATSEAENSIRAERARLMDTEQTVLLDAITSFVNSFRDAAVLKLNINNEQVIKRQLEATRDRFQVGEITRTDVHQAEARLARAVADRIQSEGDLEISRANYENVVGEMAPKQLQAPTLPEGMPNAFEEVQKLAATKNPNVIGAEFDKRAAVDNADEVMGELLPTVTLDAEWKRDIQSAAENGRTSTKSLTVNVSVPIYQQGAVYSRLREARQTAAQRTLTIDQQRRDAVESAAQAWESLLTARARVKAFSTQIEANIVALEGVQREAAVGSRTVLDVLDAEQELLDSRVSHVRVQRDELVASYQLLSAIGRLTARDLGLGVTRYDPRKHYNEVRGKFFGGTSQGGVK
jgi:outer membrane protein